MWVTAQWLTTLQRMSTCEEQPHVGAMRRKNCEERPEEHVWDGIEQYYCSAHFILGENSAKVLSSPVISLVSSW